MIRWLLVLAACGGEPSVDKVSPVTAKPVTETPTPEAVGIHEGEQHPPIPANSPAWRHDPRGFVPDVRFYGERSWDDVRMRVAGHIYVVDRDRARLKAMNGAWVEASKILVDLAGRLDTLRPKDSGVSSAIVDQLIAAASRDAGLLSGLDDGTVPTSPRSSTTFAGLRARYLASARTGHLPAADGQNLLDELAIYTKPRPDLDLGAFADFDDRHALRVRLWEAHLDAADPLGIDEPWGYFDGSEVQRQAHVLRRAVAGLAGLPSPDDPLEGIAPDLSSISPVHHPTRLATALRMPGQAARFTVEDLGALPTGDSLIDMAGEPGPRSIGRLQKWGLDDVEHRAWLEDQASRLNDLLGKQSAAIPNALVQMVQTLDAGGHGSRYYNIKQMRNSAVRQLARSGQPALARTVLAMNEPLHHQDWECPNRAGILAAIDGRLAALAGASDAEDRLLIARARAEAFLKEVEQAEAR